MCIAPITNKLYSQPVESSLIIMTIGGTRQVVSGGGASKKFCSINEGAVALSVATFSNPPQINYHIIWPKCIGYTHDLR